MMEAFVLHHGDCLDVLRTMQNDSIDACVTDPPYGLTSAKKGGSGVASINLESPYGRARIGTGNGQGGFMGMKWDSNVPPVEIWREVIRVLKPGAHLLAFAGTRTQHRMTINIEDAGFEIRDMIAWVYGSGFPKSHNLDGEWQGWGTALKPALEPITVARKPLVGTVSANMRTHGTGALNIDGCRIGLNVGRWPANLIHDGGEEVLAALPAAKGQQGAVGPQYGDETSINTYGDFGPRQEFQPRSDSGSAARFFYCAKASKSDRDEGVTIPAKPYVQFQTANGTSGKASSLSEGRNTEYRNHHPTVKPTELMRYLCRLITRPGGIILDPFMGSGSTGKAALLEGFNFIGIEREADYIEIARARISHAHQEVADDQRQAVLL